MTREEQIINDSTLDCYVDKQRGWINEAFMDGVIWADNNRPIDWKQVRIQSAIAAMQGILTSKTMLEFVDMSVKIGESHGKEVSVDSAVARMAVGFADALVKELKGE